MILMQQRLKLQLVAIYILIGFALSACNDQGRVPQRFDKNDSPVVNSAIKSESAREAQLSPGSSQDSQVFVTCLNSGKAAVGIFRDVFQCYKDEYGRLDLILNDVYRTKIQFLEPSKRASLRKIQRAWIAEKEKTCSQFSVDKAGPQTDEDILKEMSCLIDFTNKRIEFLNKY